MTINTDPTEQERRALIPEMPHLVAQERAAGRPVWTTDEMRELFTVEAFAAPFVMARRKSDDVRGTLMFEGAPRWYFGFVPA